MNFTTTNLCPLDPVTGAPVVPRRHGEGCVAFVSKESTPVLLVRDRTPCESPCERPCESRCYQPHRAHRHSLYSSCCSNRCSPRRVAFFYWDSSCRWSDLGRFEREQAYPEDWTVYIVCTREASYDARRLWNRRMCFARMELLIVSDRYGIRWMDDPAVQSIVRTVPEADLHIVGMGHESGRYLFSDHSVC